MKGPDHQDRNSGRRPVAPIPALITVAIVAVMPVQFAYSLFFNLIPRGIRLPIAGIVMLVYIVIALVGLFRRSGNWRLPAVIAVIIPIVTWSIAIMVDPSVFDMRIVLRQSVPFIAVIAVLSFPDAVPLRMLGVLAAISLLLAAAQAFGGDPYIRGGIVRLHPFTGGEDGLHASTYFTFGNVIIIDQLRRHKLLPSVAAWGLIALGIVIIAMFEVRTVWLMLVIYYISCLYIQSCGTATVRALTYFTLFMAGLGVIGFLLLTDMDIGQLGSGRIAAYGYRFNLLANRDVTTFLFGSGPGTDLFTSQGWMEKLRGSHNDFINVFIERGLIGFLGALSFLLALFLRLKGIERSMLYTMIGAALVSNAYLTRPANMIYLIWAMSIPLAHRLLADMPEREHRRKTSPKRVSLSEP